MPMLPLAAYADRFSVRPGETIAFKVSSLEDQAYEAQLVRVISCDPSPDAPGILEEQVDAPLNGSHSGRFQTSHLGSYMRADLKNSLSGLTDFTVSAVIWPTAPHRGRQTILSLADAAGQTQLSLAIGFGGAEVQYGAARISVGREIIKRRWYRIWASYDASSGTLKIGQHPLISTIDALDDGIAEIKADGVRFSDHAMAYVACDKENGHPSGLFNGKIEDPCVQAQTTDPSNDTDMSSDALIAHWDFSIGIDTANTTDRGPNQLHGQLINLPSRAMTGSHWDGSVHRWQEKPEHYGAIHFHDDDFYDCGWETDFDYQLPENLKSGVYAVRLNRADGGMDMVPFFVPAPKGAPQSKVCVLIPTFTYTVYANISRNNTNAAMKARIEEWGAFPYGTDEYRQFARSTYNFHTDGSGVAYSSRLRPIITMRSGVLSYPDVPGSGLRHFSADGHLWYWLEKMGFDYDVITDDELHYEGAAALEGYKAVLTTSHPEYHTGNSLDALVDYTQSGGRLMYLGGNGFYWKVAVNDAWPNAVEIRRAEGGIRAWAADPGEYYNAFDGEYGGLWRRNGRPPQQLCGVGFTSQGGHIGDYYRRTEASRSSEFAWMFDGIEGEIIGDFGLSGGGAAGFELDRADKRLGTPENAVVVASSENHGDHFVLVPEDVLTNLTTWNGEPEKDLIRADMTYFETANDGAVFSVGSITFCGSLPVNDCDNNVSQLIKNVLSKFID